ncbi:hypothetical protein ACO0KY_12440 [Undibacterium sp. Dicai25W]|uniref:hypothetical protein n=1 Tax=Undibacterium sp. Dicai25W TaxID=3413034 RepID=UPI003BEF9364
MKESIDFERNINLEEAVPSSEKCVLDAHELLKSVSSGLNFEAVNVLALGYADEILENWLPDGFLMAN